MKPRVTLASARRRRPDVDVQRRQNRSGIAFLTKHRRPNGEFEILSGFLGDSRANANFGERVVKRPDFRRAPSTRPPLASKAPEMMKENLGDSIMTIPPESTHNQN